MTPVTTLGQFRAATRELSDDLPLAVKAGSSMLTDLDVPETVIVNDASKVDVRNGRVIVVGDGAR